MRSIRANILIFLRLVKLITFARLFNLIKLFISFQLSRIFKRIVFSGMPWSISVEPTNACNLSCPECPTGTKGLSRPSGSIDQDLFEKLLNQSRKKAFFLNLYFQGEPFLNKNLLSLINIAKSQKFFVCCATNAHFIDKDMAARIVASSIDHLIISFDGTTQESYEKYRIGGNLDLVKSAIKLLSDEKKKQNKRYPVITMQFLILNHNIHQMKDAKKMIKTLGADNLVYKTAQLYNLSNENPYLPDNPLYTRYRIHSKGVLTLKKSVKNKCWKSWSSCVVTWDGRVVPCCFDKDASHCYGNLGNNSLNEILNNDTSNEFKTRILENRKEIDICKNCTEV